MPKGYDMGLRAEMNGRGKVSSSGASQMQNGIPAFEQFFEDGFGRDQAGAAPEVSFKMLVMHEPFADVGNFDLGAVHFPDLARLEPFHDVLFI